MLEALLKWDRETFVYLNSLGLEEYDIFWSTVTSITTWTPLFFIFILLFFLKYPRKDAFIKLTTVLSLVVFVIVITNLTKIGVARLRPNNDVEINTLIRILKSPTDYSFFSGHASSSFSITTLMVLLLWKKVKWSLLFFIWPILFCMSRIYVGVHFPLDIIAGAVIGTLSGILFYRIYRHFFKKHELLS